MNYVYLQRMAIELLKRIGNRYIKQNNRTSVKISARRFESFFRTSANVCWAVLWADKKTVRKSWTWIYVEFFANFYVVLMKAFNLLNSNKYFIKNKNFHKGYLAKKDLKKQLMHCFIGWSGL